MNVRIRNLYETYAVQSSFIYITRIELLWSNNDCARSRTRVIGDEEEIKNGVEYIKGL